MFTDMVGYTALGQRNETLSLALVDEQRKIIRPVFGRHGGREVKTIGDGFLVEFPNAVDAVRCAYDVQRAVREFNLSLESDKRIHLRIGIHVGEVVESRGDIAGDAVNVASRIEPLAEDGGVCLTRQVFDHVQNKVDLSFLTLGPKSLRNVTAPIEVYSMSMPWEHETAIREKLDKRRIAVLPLANMSPDPNDEYFADGMTEELIGTISQIRDLRVIARTSAMRYKGEKKSVAEIGKELEIGSLIEGSVRKAGDRLRITIQLLNTQTQEHIWSQNYDRELKDVFAVQSEIAERVADALEVKLLGSNNAPVQGSVSENVPAYLAYLKGRALLDRRSLEGYKEAKEQFEWAISQDPNYAPAYAGLAETWYVLGGREAEGVPIQLARKNMEECALKAISLDDRLPEAHVTLGIKLQDEYDWKGAESEFKRAIELRQDYAHAHRYYAEYLMNLGLFSQAQTEIELAEGADPLSAEVLMLAIYVHCCLRQLDSALLKLEKATKLDPENPHLYEFWAFYNYRKGDYASAVDWLERRLSKSRSQYYYLSGALGSLYVNIGKRDKAMEIKNKLLAQPEDVIGRANNIAFICGYLGDPDECFEWATRAVEEKSLSLIDFRLDPELQYIRDDPRWMELLKKANLDA
jgi:TolB-like protein/Tfp pilus assembly protein PilF